MTKAKTRKKEWKFNRDFLVSQEFRNFIYDKYPILNQKGEHQEFFKGMMQYILFTDFRERDTGNIVIPYTIILNLMGVRRRGNIKTYDYLKLFNDEVLPIKDYPYCHFKKRARRIEPQWDEEFEENLNRMIEEMNLDPSKKEVYFKSGKTLTQYYKRKMQKENIDYFNQLIIDNKEDHPAKELMDYLNNEGQLTIKHIYEKNRMALEEKYQQMPMKRNEDKIKKLIVNRIILNLDESEARFAYGDSDKTSRIYAKGPNINQLPSEFREIALHGCYKFDLRSAQLAIVEKLYECPILNEFLNSKKSIWKEFQDYLEVDETYKKILKRTIYSIVFGMGMNNLNTQLMNGRYEMWKGEHTVWSDYDLGLGKEKADKFFKHPIIAELMDRRSFMTKKVTKDGGMMDAFERLIPRFNEWSTKSVLACVAQSYEMKIMLSMLPLVKTCEDMTITSFLHDGVYIYFTDESKKERRIRQLCEAVDNAAKEMGFLTSFEYEEI